MDRACRVVSIKTCVGKQARARYIGVRAKVCRVIKTITTCVRKPGTSTYHKVSRALGRKKVGWKKQSRRMPGR